MRDGSTPSIPANTRASPFGGALVFCLGIGWLRSIAANFRFCFLSTSVSHNFGYTFVLDSTLTSKAKCRLFKAARKLRWTSPQANVRWFTTPSIPANTRASPFGGALVFCLGIGWLRSIAVNFRFCAFASGALAGDDVFDIKATDTGWQVTVESSSIKDKTLQVALSDAA